MFTLTQVSYLLTLNLISCAAAAQSSQQFKCGRISLPPQYRISAQGLLQDINTGIQVSANTGDVYCTCSNELEPSSSQQELSVPVQYLEGEVYHAKFRFISPCQLAVCHQSGNHTLSLLQVSSSGTLELRLEEGSAVCSTLQGVFERPSSTNGWVTARVEDFLQNDCLRNFVELHDQIRRIEITFSLNLTNRASTVVVPAINITQSILFDVGSCLSRRLIQSPSLISLLPWQSRMFSQEDKQKTSNHPKNSKISHRNNIIHSQPAHKRWLRQVNRRPSFAQLHYTPTVVENSDIGTTVDTITAIDTDEGANGVVMYAMTPDDEFSRGLFAIDSRSGVITTTG